MVDYDLWRAKTSEDLAREYLLGEPDPERNRWWICGWQWHGSKYWKRLCQIDEAVQQLAWELNPPVLTVEQEQIWEAIALLNAWARANKGHGGIDWQWKSKAVKQVYWLKREAIKLAMDEGLVLLRLIRWLGKCRTCGGTGEWVDYWHDGKYVSPCRRCSGRGWVRLDFIECNVVDRYVFHQPYDHTHPFKQCQIERLQPHPAGTWYPNQPGIERIDREQLSGMLRFLKRVYWINQPGYVHEIYEYMHEVI